MRICLLLFLVLISCKKTQQEKQTDDKTKPEMSLVKDHNTYDKISSNFKSQIETWNELKNIETFLQRFQKASANEILSNAIELKGLTRSLQDSIKPDLFSLTSVEVRINIFQNEVLRLADMTTIPAIKAKEVHEQANKIMDAFSSINAKINTILRKKQFEEAIDIDVSFIGLDTTKIDSVSRKSINLKKLEEQPKKLSPPKLNKRQQ